MGKKITTKPVFVAPEVATSRMVGSKYRPETPLFFQDIVGRMECWKFMPMCRAFCGRGALTPRSK
jgi:hypothetical protein